MNFDKYRVNPDKAVDLTQFDTHQDGGKKDSELKKMRNTVWQELADYQDRLYAESKQ